MQRQVGRVHPAYLSDRQVVFHQRRAEPRHLGGGYSVYVGVAMRVTEHSWKELGVWKPEASEHVIELSLGEGGTLWVPHAMDKFVLQPLDQVACELVPEACVRVPEFYCFLLVPQRAPVPEAKGHRVSLRNATSLQCPLSVQVHPLVIPAGDTRVFVECDASTRRALLVNLEESVASLKARIEALYGHHRANQNLFCYVGRSGRHRLLLDRDSLAESGVGRDSTVRVHQRPRGDPYNWPSSTRRWWRSDRRCDTCIPVTTLCKTRRIVAVVGPDALVEDLHLDLANLTGIPPSKIRLVFEGSCLALARPVSAYQLREGSSPILVVRGGCLHAAARSPPTGAVVRLSTANTASTVSNTLVSGKWDEVQGLLQGLDLLGCCNESRHSGACVHLRAFESTCAACATSVRCCHRWEGYRLQ